MSSRPANQVSRAVRVPLGHQAVVDGQVLGVASGLLQPRLVDLAQHDDGVVIGALPRFAVQLPEQPSGVGLPGPVEVVTEVTEPVDALGEVGPYRHVAEDLHGAAFYTGAVTFHG